ncbi:MAG TPA: GxxExxY protein [bacterium]|jgi:GxxExxY protein
MGADERDPETYAVIGAAMEVHRVLGHGFLENVYQEALALELEERGIPFRREVALDVYYKGRQLSGSYRADFVCFDSLILELQAVSNLVAAHKAQLIHYLRATRSQKGLLLNFGLPSLDFQRYVLS